VSVVNSFEVGTFCFEFTHFGTFKEYEKEKRAKEKEAPQCSFEERVRIEIYLDEGLLK
jgi:hypothetical protein